MVKKFEIESLKDLKDVLKGVPNKVLKDYGLGIAPEYSDLVQVLCWSNDAELDYTKHMEKYKGWQERLDVLSRLFQNIAYAINQFEENPDEYEDTEPITSKQETKKGVKKK